MKKRGIKHILLSAAVIAALQVGTLYAADTPAELDADTVEYNTATGLVTAEGDVLMKYGASKMSGARASYNAKTQQGFVEGNVIAVRENMRLTADRVNVDGQDHIMAVGNVHGTQEDKSITGSQVDFYPKQGNYVLMEDGGLIASADGTFQANRLEGWMDEEHYAGTGNAHLVSPPKDLEAGGDRMDYYGKEQGKIVLTGNAWALQENHSMKSNRLTIYLADNGEAKVQ